FLRPPTADPPVRALRDSQRLILSENTAEGSRQLVAGGDPSHSYQVPAGRRKGSLDGADHRFFRSQAVIPGKVFDARRDFGAQGDGPTDDTQAIQRCIDAARLHGHGAIAYLPSGVYNVTETLKITGSDYLVGGSGFLTKLYWRGSERGTIVEVHEPDRITLQYISIGNHDVGPMNNAIDVLQTGSAAPSRMTYESVFTFGMYQKEPFRKGLHLRGLGPEEVVVLSGVQGNLRIVDSAAATILARTSYEGSVIVEGASPRRDGFLGFLARLSTITRHGLYVRDNHSIVMSDYYIEQADNGLVFEGAAENAPGRVVLQGAKLQFNVPKDKPEEGTAMTLGGYRGEIFFGPGQFYIEPAQVRIRNVGATEPELLILSSLFYQTRLDLGGGPLKLRLLGNEDVGQVTAEGQASYRASSDLEPQAALASLPRALDELRRLGELDLQLNHPSSGENGSSR
ncbi:MAG: glycosyl hydrolase family 28-related protein, partial [Thermoguttaceae bacterium]